MKEIVFSVEESQDGSFFAKAINHAIFTQCDTLEQLNLMIRDAVRCYFNEGEMLGLIHLHVTCKEIFSL